SQILRKLYCPLSLRSNRRNLLWWSGDDCFTGHFIADFALLKELRPWKIDLPSLDP
ncbi:unnamed protein product, partial [Linum tenue]